MTLPILLASSSRYRRLLLERLNLPFQYCSPDIDESADSGESAEHLARRLAEEKARAVAGEFPEHLIVGSDQVAALGDEILSKPGDFDRAYRQLTRASGQEVAFHTAAALLDTTTGKCDLVTDTTVVKFRHLAPEEIRRYLDAERPFDCAGSFKVEGLGITLFENVKSGDPTALIGLPLIKLSALLRARGYRLP